jgi:UDP-N-acetylmuramate: L-alanyl-gamma-D-glutamyl-meso-diaminopimelate ligase
MRVHLVGVSGTGMGALASLFREAGHEVSGSDVAFDPPIGPTLRALGVRCFEGYDAAHIEGSLDLVVIGNAIRRNNPEAEAAERLGVARTSMSGALREQFLTGRRPLVVAGTHGKTTTSAMCAWLLERAGLEPGWFIGGIPKGLKGGASIGSTKVRLGTGRSPFVVEGDEYDAVYWHKQPKFLDYLGVGTDDVAIVTSIEHDHVDIYPDMASYDAAFRALFRAIPEGGLIVCNAQDARIRALAPEARARIAWVALEHDDTGDVTPTWLAAPARGSSGRHVPGSAGAWSKPEAVEAFDLFAGGVACGRFVLRVPGRHNVRNALSAIAACAEAFQVDVAAARGHMALFEGVRRRQDLLGTPRGVRVYDDFAHHPTAVDETLRALRSRHPDGALWVAFEPRSATACRALHQEAYRHAFDVADHVLLAPLGRTNVPEGERLDLKRLASELGPKAEAVTGVDAIVARIAQEARDGDTVALFSNGAFGGVHEKVLAALGQKAAAR